MPAFGVQLKIKFHNLKKSEQENADGRRLVVNELTDANSILTTHYTILPNNGAIKC
jgi:hypothetical protein